MKIEELYTHIFNIYRKYNITKLPIDCFDIIDKCGLVIKKYSELPVKKRQACMTLSPDACTFKKVIYYNDLTNSKNRIRFSLMHELGHIILSTQSEDEADEFASHILAPRVIIHQKNYRNADQIHDAFELSYQASNRALANYKLWFEQICRTTKKPSVPEQQIENLFKETEFEKEKIVDITKNFSKVHYELEECHQFFNQLNLDRGFTEMYYHAEKQWLCKNSR